MTKKILNFCLVLISIVCFSQKAVKTELVVERGKFILDQALYQKYKRNSGEAIISQRKSDSINTLNNGTSSTFINDATLYPPHFKSASGNFRTYILQDLKISEKTHPGKNTFCIVLDQFGNVKKIISEKVSDHTLSAQIKKKLKSQKSYTWAPAYFHSANSGFRFRFSVIADYSFEEYNLKNQWAGFNDSNLSDFEKENKKQQ